MNIEKNQFKNIEPDWIARRFQEHIKGSFHESLGIQIIQLEQGHCITRTEIHPEDTNHMGSLHGGFLYTIADTTAGLASIPLGTGTDVTTIDSHLQFLRPAIGLHSIYGEAETIKSGKRIIFTDVRIMTEEGLLLAKGSFTFALIEIPDHKMPVFNLNNLSES